MSYFSVSPTKFSIYSENLSGLLYTPESDTELLPAIVIFHGRGTSKQRYTDRATLLAEAGFLVFVFDFRGCGDSDGVFENQSVDMGYEDALAGYNYVYNLPKVDRKKIGVFGGSFGGYQAACLSAERPIRSLVIEAPATYKDEWLDETPATIDREALHSFWQTEDVINNQAIRAIKEFEGYLLVVEHEKDEEIPQRVTRAYFTEAKETRFKDFRVIKDAPHPLFDEKLRTESNEMSRDWFVKTML